MLRAACGRRPLHDRLAGSFSGVHRVVGHLMRREPTQNERILALLGDGRWHTTRQILQAVPCIVHSRVAEINARAGYRIEHDGAGGGAENHRYRLTATPGGREPSAGTSAPVATRDTRTVDASSLPPGTATDAALDEPSSGLAAPAQLSLLGQAAA